MDGAKTGEKELFSSKLERTLILSLAISFAEYPMSQELFVVLKHICSNWMSSWVLS